MLRMDPFKVELPSSSDEVVALLAEHKGNAKLCAGGTDVVPNLKHGLHEPEVLIHLTRAADLLGIEETDDELIFGARVTLHDIAHDERVREHCPGLAVAASHVAGPQLRRMGTLGGNLCLDTRCLYYNQTHFWREALGYCLKKDGDVCHVAAGTKCVAAASNDCATMLLALDTVVELKRSEGGKVSTRELPLDQFYVAEGRKNTVLEDGEMLTRIRVKKGSSMRLEGFAKLRHREAIDYPLLSVAVGFDLGEDNKVIGAKCTVNALAARPKQVKADMMVGEELNDAAIEALAAKAFKQCHPLTNITGDTDWRKAMVPVFIKQACERARRSR